jgi:hypothetical protein
LIEPERPIFVSVLSEIGPSPVADRPPSQALRATGRHRAAQSSIDSKPSTPRSAAVSQSPGQGSPEQLAQRASATLRGPLSVGDRSNANKALQEMSDDSLQGYAIVAGSSGRRDLFNWWLVAALPAARSERLPDEIFRSPPHTEQLYRW